MSTGRGIEADVADIKATEGVRYLSKDFQGPIKVAVDYAGNDSHSIGVQVEISGFAEEPATLGDPKRVTFVMGMWHTQARQLAGALEDAIHKFEERLSADDLETLYDESPSKDELAAMVPSNGV